MNPLTGRSRSSRIRIIFKSSEQSTEFVTLLSDQQMGLLPHGGQLVCISGSFVVICVFFLRRAHQRPPNYASVFRWSLRKHLSLRPREETDFAISEASEFEHMALVYRTSVGKILADARAVVHVAASCFPVSRSSHIWSHPKRGHFRTLRLSVPSCEVGPTFLHNDRPCS